MSRAYIDGLKMLARRELSEAQVRQRLPRHHRDDRELQRLFRYLVGQGFESDRIMRTLTSRRRRE